MSNDMEKALKQDREFIACFIRQIPSMTAEVKQRWIENPRALKELLSVLSPEERVRCLSKLKNGTTLPARTKEFDPEVAFNRRYVWELPGFDDIILKHAQTVAFVPEIPVLFCDLIKNAKYKRIRAKLPKDHIFSLEIFLPFLAGLTDRQSKGESGDLLNNGSLNIFYVHVGSRYSVVLVNWDSDIHEWSYDAYYLSDDYWFAGRVFPAAAGLKLNPLTL